MHPKRVLGYYRTGLSSSLRPLFSTYPTRSEELLENLARALSASAPPLLQHLFEGADFDFFQDRAIFFFLWLLIRQFFPAQVFVIHSLLVSEPCAVVFLQSLRVHPL